MANDEYYSFHEYYEKNKKEPEEVKRLISEGSIQVFREADQVKLKAAPETGAAKKKKAAVKRLSADESLYYANSCLLFREERWLLAGSAALLLPFLLLPVALLPAPQGIFAHVSCFFLGLASFALAASLFSTVLSASFLGRFSVLAAQQTKAGDRKSLLSFFNQGYSAKQAAKLLWVTALDSIVFAVIFQALGSSLPAGIALLVGCIVLGGIWWRYRQRIEKCAAEKLPRKIFSCIEEDASNVFPGASPKEKEEKAELDDSVAVSSLIAVLSNKSTRVRRDAIKTLGRIGSPDAVNALVGALGDTAPEVRAQAVFVLGTNDEKSALDSIKCLFHDDSSLVRAAVIEALGYLKDEDALDLLLVAMEDKAPEVRGAAAEAMGRLEKRKTIPYLTKLMGDADWFVRHKSTIALGKMRSHLTIDPVEHLIQALDDENEYVSLTAEHILHKLSEEMPQKDPLYDEIAEALAKKSKENAPAAPAEKKDGAAPDAAEAKPVPAPPQEASAPQEKKADAPPQENPPAPEARS